MPSSVIRSFSYDSEARRLVVRFVSGRVYTYAGVPADIAANLDAAPSKGRYFNEMVRDHFPFTRAHPAGR